jgi:hypothetical protein
MLYSHASFAFVFIEVVPEFGDSSDSCRELFPSEHFVEDISSTEDIAIGFVLALYLVIRLYKVDFGSRVYGSASLKSVN